MASEEDRTPKMTDPMSVGVFKNSNPQYGTSVSIFCKIGDAKRLFREMLGDTEKRNDFISAIDDVVDNAVPNKPGASYWKRWVDSEGNTKPREFQTRAERELEDRQKALLIEGLMKKLEAEGIDVSDLMDSDGSIDEDALPASAS